MHLVPLTSSRKAHDNIQPTMTQVVPQLSLETIFRDYCRGVLHPELSRSGMYDPDWIDDDKVDFYLEAEDISDLLESEIPQVSEEKPEETPVSSQPAETENQPTS